MTDNSQESPETERPRPDNRHYSRRPIISYFEVADDNGGIALDLSEGGLRIQAVRELTTDDSLDLRFQPSQSTTWIEAKARIVWTSETRRIAGVEFISLPDQTRRVLRGFLGKQPEDRTVDRIGTNTPTPVPAESYAEATAGRADVLTSPYVGRSSNATTALPKSEIQVEKPTPSFILGVGSGRTADRPRSRSIVVFTALFCLVALLVIWLTRPGNLSGSLRGFQRLISEKPVTIQPVAPVSVSPPSSGISQAPAPTPAKLIEPKPPAPPPPFSPAPGVPGIVLQVGAMSHEENANALLQSLTGKDFPAFVFRKGTDPLYKVAVGPYPDRRSVDAAKQKLAAQGIKFIEKRWLP